MCSRKGPKWPGRPGTLKKLRHALYQLCRSLSVAPRACCCCSPTEFSEHMDGQPSSELDMQEEPIPPHRAPGVGGSAMALWPHGTGRTLRCRRLRGSDSVATQDLDQACWSVLPGFAESLPWNSWVCSCQTRYLLKSWAGPAGMSDFQDP